MERYHQITVEEQIQIMNKPFSFAKTIAKLEKQLTACHERIEEIQNHITALKRQ